MSHLNLTDEEIITKYQALKKQMNISFYAICVMTIIIGTIVWAIGGHFLVGAIASSAFALLAFMGFIFYFFIDAAELEGLYQNVTRKKIKQNPKTIRSLSETVNIQYRVC